MHEAVEQRVGDGWVGDQVVPLGDRQLARDDGGAQSGPVVDDVHDVVCGLSIEGCKSPVVEYQHIDSGDGRECLEVGAVGTGQCESEDEPSWRNSMEYMYKVLNTPALPDGCGVAIEFSVPYTSSRIDFLLTGRQDGAHRETAHPSYQAWSYARMIEDYNEAIRQAEIELVSCAYLHNYRESPMHDPLRDPAYLEYLERPSRAVLADEIT